MIELRVPVADARRWLTAYRRPGPVHAPVVVCEAGLGGDHQDWDRLLPLITPRATVVTYDRAGCGKSPPAAERRLTDLAADLGAVLTSEAPSGAIVVGHSLGARIARAATALLPAGAVTGLVLIDGAADGIVAAFPQIDRHQRHFLALAGALCPLGITRLPALRHWVARTSGELVDSPAVAAMLANMSRRAFWRAGRREWDTMAEEIVGHRSAVPAVALLARRWRDWSSSQHRLIGASDEQLLDYTERDFRRLYPGGTVIRVEDTSHRIHREHPDLVAEALMQLLATMRPTIGPAPAARASREAAP